MPLDWAQSFGNQGVALAQLAERTKDPTKAETALRQMEAALEMARVSGHAPLAADLETHLLEARRIRAVLTSP